MTADPHDHRPGRAAQRATIAIARAALTVTHYWIALAAILDGNRDGIVTEQVRRKLLAAADATEREIDSAAN